MVQGRTDGACCGRCLATRRCLGLCCAGCGGRGREWWAVARASFARKGALYLGLPRLAFLRIASPTSQSNFQFSYPARTHPIHPRDTQARWPHHWVTASLAVGGKAQPPRAHEVLQTRPPKWAIFLLALLFSSSSSPPQHKRCHCMHASLRVTANANPMTKKKHKGLSRSRHLDPSRRSWLGRSREMRIDQRPFEDRSTRSRTAIECSTQLDEGPRT